MSTEVNIDNFDEKLKFEIKLQIALRKTAMKTSEYYDDKEKFNLYIKEREEKLRSLLKVKGDFSLFENHEKIYP